MRRSDDQTRETRTYWRRRSPFVAILAVTAAFGIMQAASIMKPPARAEAIICVGIGNIIGISDCFGGHRDYAPLPAYYPPPAPPPPPPTTTAPPPPSTPAPPPPG